MNHRFALFDLENVQPSSLNVFKAHGYQLKIFVGAGQLRIPVALASQVQEFGKDAEYITMQGTGRNALDFHIAYYLGRLVTQYPEAEFCIVSNDTGYDPLLTHLQEQHIKAKRIEVKPNPNKAPKVAPEPLSDDAWTVIAYLHKLTQSKPVRRKTLSNALHTLFQKKYSESDIQTLIDELISHNAVQDNHGRMHYSLPSLPASLS